MESVLPLLNQTETEENQQPEQKEKKKKKKKRAAANLRKLQAKAAEEARANLLRQKQEYLRDTKARVQAEWEANHMKAEVYILEYKEREAALNEASRRIEETDSAWLNYEQERKKAREWKEYMNCNGLPSPSSLSQMNSYIYVWTEFDWTDQMSQCMKKTEEVMELLDVMEEIIQDPGPQPQQKGLNDMKELRGEIRRLLQEHIDKASFYLFSRIESEMNPENVSISTYSARCPHFFLGLWADSYTPMSRGKEARKPLKITFEDADLTIIIPVSLLDVHKVIRAMLLNYDHWSEKCRTFECPATPFYYSRTLNELFVTEFGTKRDIIKYREFVEILTKKKVAALPPEPTLSQEIMAWDTTPQRALSDEVMYKECELEDNMARQTKSILNEFEVNLRERTFLGEFLLFEVLQQPPQAQCFRLKHCITLRQEPPKLKLIDFYEPPQTLPPQEEEEPEKKDDKKKTDESKGAKTDDSKGTKTDESKGTKTDESKGGKTDESKGSKPPEEEKYICFRIKIAQTVLWYETPQLANWDPVHGYWSTEDIHDVIYDSNESVVSFKTGRLGLTGFHVATYCLFPFEDWMIEPNEEGGVNFYLKTSVTEFRFRIKDCEVCLEEMENCPGEALNWILGKYYTPFELFQNLKKGGINLIAAPDATGYIAGIKSKHVVIESNAYQTWGIFSKTFRFKRSKFNQQAERGNIVFQAQEVYKNHQVDFCLIQTTMCTCFVLDINEESKTYSPDMVPGSEKYVDLYTLLSKNSTGYAKRQIKNTSFQEIQTIKEVLGNIRPISFS